MLPHQAILKHIPPTSSSRRRTVHFGAFNSKERSSLDQIHIRELNIDNVGLGCALWDGSIVLSRWLYANSHLFANRSVLELGSGVGLPGLMASRYASTVYLTDYIPDLIDNLHYNLKVNTNLEEEVGEDGADSADQLEYKRRLKVNMIGASKMGVMDWHSVREREGISTWRFDVEGEYDKHPEESPNGDPLHVGADYFDFVIGSEIMYTPSSQHRHSLCRTLNFYLKPSGTFYLVQSPNREGMDLFIKLIVGKYRFHLKEITKMDKFNGDFYRGMKKPKGFVQRSEDYYLYEFQKYAQSSAAPLPMEEEVDLRVVAPSFPSLQYAMDEEKIKREMTTHNDEKEGGGGETVKGRDEIEKIMNNVVSKAWKAEEEKKKR